MRRILTVRIEHVGDRGVRHDIAVWLLWIRPSLGEDSERALRGIDLCTRAGQPSKARIRFLQKGAHHLWRIAFWIYRDVEGMELVRQRPESLQNGRQPGQSAGAYHATVGKPEKDQHEPAPIAFVGDSCAVVVNEPKRPAHRWTPGHCDLMGCHNRPRFYAARFHESTNVRAFPSGQISSSALSDRCSAMDPLPTSFCSSPDATATPSQNSVHD